MDKNKANVPKIRFPGFTGSWEQRKVKDIFKVTRGYVLAATETTDKKTDETPYPVYSSQTKDNGLLGYYKNFLYENAITWTTDGANAGTVNYRAGKFYCTNVCGVLLSDDGYANKMVSEVLNNISWKYVSKVGNPKLMNNVMSEIVVLLPKTIEEQNTISDFLDRLDDLITLHQCKLNHLQDEKKGLLQKMFPKKGENFPELRFPGFTDPWEQRKLGEVAEIIGGGTPSTGNPKYWDGDIDWYSPVEIGKQIYVDNSQKKITELGLQKSSAKILPVGTVLFTSRAGIGNTAILAKEGCTNQGFQSIVPHKDELDSYFIFSRTHELKQYGETNGAGSTFMEISGKQMAKMPILIPSMEEQDKIGDFFEKLDNLITLHQRKLNHLQEQKKALLQQMFI